MNITVPRDRAGQIHTQAFERYSRYEPHIADELTQMFVDGNSTDRVGEVAQTLLGVAPSASNSIRCRNTGLYCTWVTCISAFGMATMLISITILTALGVDLVGNIEVLALRACTKENKDGWASLLQDLRSRGATEIDFFMIDDHDGLLADVSELFAATPRKRCLVNKQLNVLNAIHR